MAKLYFRYSAMDAGKTLDIIKVAYNYTDKGQKVEVWTSELDTRSGRDKIQSRVGMSLDAVSISKKDDLYLMMASMYNGDRPDCILVDEIQFFTVEQIIQLSDIVDYMYIPVICYGLRSDYCGRPFASSAHLLAIADSIEELKTICHCGKKATHNMLLKNGVAVKKGDAVVIDDTKLSKNNKEYVSVCRKHWKQG